MTAAASLPGRSDNLAHNVILGTANKPVSCVQVLAKLRAELTFSVFESVDAADNETVNPQRDAFVATGEMLVHTYAGHMMYRPQVGHFSWYSGGTRSQASLQLVVS